MLARLWWKEFRLFWPVWLFITLSALATQWLGLWFFERDARNGVLGYHAVGWAFLYAAAVASSAFAAEREQRTLRFLDTLPVSRTVLWSGKTSFAIVTTLIFGLALILVSKLGTDFEVLGFGKISGERDSVNGSTLINGPTQSWIVFLSSLVLLVETIGWGLFWSSLTSNVLASAALTVTSVGILVPYLMQRSNFSVSWWDDSLLYRVIIAGITIVVSLLILNHKPRPSSLTRSRRSSREAEPAAMDRDLPTIVKEPRYWPLALRSLLWQTIREMRRTWACLFGVAVLTSFLFTIREMNEPFFVMVIGCMSAIIAGISVFGIQNRVKSQRFLAHQGAGPGLVWMVKLGLWSLAALALCLPVLAIAFIEPRAYYRQGEQGMVVLVFLVVMVYGFTAGQLCGMLIRRSITAGLICFLLTLLLSLIAIGQFRLAMMAPWEFILAPLALILLSRIWARDWLDDRQGARPWIKFGIATASLCMLIFVIHMTHRVYEIPVVPTFVNERFLLTQQPPTPIADKDNAAPLYRKALLERERSYSTFIPDTSNATPAEREGYRQALENEQAKQNREFDLLREGSALPACRLSSTGGATRYATQGVELNPYDLVRPFAAHILQTIPSGDLDQTWRDILALINISRQFQTNQAISESRSGALAEGQAISLAVLWTSDPRQTPARVKQALKDFQSIANVSKSDTILQAEWRIVRQILELPRAKLSNQVMADMTAPSHDRLENVWSVGISKLSLTPWEIARARRTLAELFVAKIMESREEPFRRLIGGGLPYHSWPHTYVPHPEESYYRSPYDLQYDFDTTPIARALLPTIDNFLANADRTEALRRGFSQFLALRAWQLEHDGNLPEKLAEIVPILIDPLPDDPFTGKPFRYFVAEQQRFNTPINESASWLLLGARKPNEFPTEGRHILLSIGTDFQAASTPGSTSSDDLVFVLPPAKNDPKIVPRIEVDPSEDAATLLPDASASGMAAEMMQPQPATPPPSSSDKPKEPEKKDEPPAPKG